MMNLQPLGIALRKCIAFLLRGGKACYPSPYFCSLLLPHRPLHRAMRRKAMIILTVWFLVIGVIGLVVMIGLIFYLLYTLNFFGSYALHFPQSYEESVVFTAAESCFSYYDPTIQRWYPSLLDARLVNDGNLTKCIGSAYGVKAVLRGNGIAAEAKTPGWKSEDSAKALPVIVYDPIAKTRTKATLYVSLTLEAYEAPSS
ncbi:MAG: hypothetical protein QW594_04380 [Candidatus Woesearchaeota archaeon]